ncbi:MAG: 3-hydroxyacyl-CoA dehydrogenase NAD-binding domain-containing protein, partial [Cyclobacteriaceae bacterium]|nr:3-hydroxyacyl-CoA dehydrogenase NAD-binding domain-containing protein [Cyclobacteriaceae bacterium]
MNNIVVIGAGTMGNGIAHVFAQQEKKVILNDISQDALDKAINTIAKNMDRQVSKGDFSAKEKEKYLAGIVLSTQLEDSLKAADLVIEAATENSNLKLDIFKTIDQHAPGHAILASNTSSISITKIAAATKRPDKVIGMHFMNPVPVMKLVEVINGYNTSPATTDTILNESKNLGKVPVVVNDYPGFIANRLLMPLINEAIYALHEGVAGVGEIDTVMKLGMA